MPSPAQPIDAGAAPSPLRLDTALALLAQAGKTLPEGGPGSREWLQALIDGLCQISSRDALTGLVNRLQFEAVLARELDRVARTGEPALLLLLDVDHFKRVNDTHGHHAGDLVLKAVAGTVLECVRPMDTVARIGGEEFAVALPNCPPAFGPMVAERIRSRVERRRIAGGLTEPIAVTVSVGGAFAPQWVRSNLTLWLARADRQLYRAKSNGRNRAEFEPAAVSQVSVEEKRLLFTTPYPDEAAPSTPSVRRAMSEEGHAASSQRARVTAITSGKGDVGKTFVAAGLATALAARGRRVLVLDADLGLANLDVVLDLAPKATLHDVFTGKRAIDQALTEVPGGFTVLLAGSGLFESSRLTPEVRDKLVETLNAVMPGFDHVLLDAGAGISDVVLYAVSLADEVLMVATPEPTSLTDTYATIKVLATTQGRRWIRLVVNHKTPGSEGRAVRAQLQQVIDRYVSPGPDRPVSLELVGEIPSDAAVRDAVRQRRLLHECSPDSVAAQALAGLAARLLGAGG